MKLLKGLHIGYIRQPWKCPACGDYFEVPNTNHSCPERRHFKDKKKSFRNGIWIGFASALMVLLLFIIIVQRNLITTYSDMFGLAKSWMEYIEKANNVLLGARYPTWGGDPEPPRKYGR